MKKLVLTVAAIALLGVISVNLAQPGPPPPHAHMLVQDFEVALIDGKPHVVGWRKCVDLAANRAVPLNAHHAGVHTGAASEALSQAGHAVVPTSPLSPWSDCAALTAALPIPLEE